MVCSQGGQRQRFKDVVKQDMESLGIVFKVNGKEKWAEVTADRKAWRKMVKTGMEHHHKEANIRAERKRAVVDNQSFRKS